MKKSNSKQKALGAFLGVAFVLLIALIGCNQADGGGNTGGGGGKPTPTPTPAKYTVTLNQTANGNVTASPAIPTDKQVAKDTVITFTATANEGYKIGKWTVTPKTALQAGTGADGSSTAKVKITADTTVSVSFEAIPEGAILTLATGKKIVSVTAKTEDGSAITVVGCTETTFNSENQTELHANENGATITLKGNIIELHVEGTYQIMGPLTAIDVSGLAKLQKLNCGSNQLTSLNVQGCVALQELHCDSNQLTSLNVSNLTALQKLNCSYNKKSLDNQTLTELNVQGCTALEVLNCPGNKLTELDVKGLIKLKMLSCNQNKLNSLDVQGLTALEELNCRKNNLTALDVSGLTVLKELDCDENQLATLNASGLTKLEHLNCNVNQLTELNVQDCTSLKFLLCYSNKLNAQAMTALLNALPQREENDNAIATLYTEETGKPEENCKDFSQPDGLKTAFEGAKTKKWGLMKMGTAFEVPIN